MATHPIPQTFRDVGHGHAYVLDIVIHGATISKINGHFPLPSIVLEKLKRLHLGVVSNGKRANHIVLKIGIRRCAKHQSCASASWRRCGCLVVEDRKRVAFVWGQKLHEKAIY